MLIQHYWNEQDSARYVRRDIADRVIEYYNDRLLGAEELSEEEREIYTSELLEYAFLADPKNGLERFWTEFDISLEDGRYDYSNLLLREAENYHRENPHDIPFPDYLEVDWRRIHHTTEVEGNYKKSLQMVNAVLEEYSGNPDWEHSSVRGHFLMERGIAEFSLEQFEKSVNSFQKAHNVFLYESADDVWIHWAHSWIGYAYYRQGRFTEAENYLTQSRDGFYNLLVERSELTEREHRHLLQGILISLGNLAMVYSYTGRFEKAIQKAEIALEIVRHLPRNSLEMARIRNAVGHVFAYAGRVIDARHHFRIAEVILQDLKSPLITGRVKTDLGFLYYRVSELSHILEYYRAEEIEKLIEKEEYVKHVDVKQARRVLEEAIAELKEEPVIKKELADAYYALGELYVVTPSKDHWQEAEKALLKSLKWGRESQFLYRVVDSLESLVTLYYFWNGASEITNEVKEENQKKMTEYQQKLDVSLEFNKEMYPDLYGKYSITLGDIKFDEALKILRSEGGIKNLDTVMNLLNKAFTDYVAAAHLMGQFYEYKSHYYYLALSVLYNRLETLVDKIQQGKTGLQKRFDELQTLWKGKSDIENIYEYVFLRTWPEEKIEEGISELQNSIQEALNEGNFGWGLLLTECLIGVYRSLSFRYPENEKYREHHILQLLDKSGYHRVLGDSYQAEQCIETAKKELESISDSQLKEGLEGCIISRKGTSKYRRGEYRHLLEFYLQDQLDLARSKFDGQFPGARDEALDDLKTGREKLKQAISFCEEKLSKEADAEKKAYLQEQIQLYCRHLSETNFRLGELLILNEQFTKCEERQKEVFGYLKEAIEDSKKGGYPHRHDDALQLYVNALYFSENYDHQDYREERIAYENQLEEKLRTNTEIYTSITGKLRITQADALFSNCFTRNPSRSDRIRRYISRESKIDVRTLRTMLRYYVEACNFTAQHGSLDFAAAVRVLQRRIELISDKFSLEEILHILPHIWNVQEHLKQRHEELEALSQFAKIRSIVLEYENHE